MNLIYRVDYKRNHGDGFYRSKDWKILKKQIIRIYGCVCMKCNYKGLVHVDHIVPRSKNKSIELDPKNLQILCRECNMSKSNSNSVDYRTKEQKRLLDVARSKNSVIKRFWNKSKDGRKLQNKKKRMEEMETERLERIALKPKVILRKRKQSGWTKDEYHKVKY